MVLVNHSANGQTELVFRKKTRPTKKIEIPFGEFRVDVKPRDGKRIRTLISSYQDSVLYLKKWGFKGEARKEIRWQIRAIRNNDQIFRAERKYQILHAKYFVTDKIKISDVRMIRIPNRKRREMTGKMILVDVLAYGGVAVYPLVALTISPTAYYAGSAALLGLAVLSGVMEHRNIRLDKWEVLDPSSR